MTGRCWLGDQRLPSSARIALAVAGSSWGALLPGTRRQRPSASRTIRNPALAGGSSRRSMASIIAQRHRSGPAPRRTGGRVEFALVRWCEVGIAGDRRHRRFHRKYQKGCAQQSRRWYGAATTEHGAQPVGAAALSALILFSDLCARAPASGRAPGVCPLRVSEWLPDGPSSGSQVAGRPHR